MAEDIHTLKMFMEGVTLYAGAKFNDEDGSGEQTIPTSGNFTLNQPSRLNADNQNQWVWDELVMTQPSGNQFAGGVSFRCYNQKRIDLTGFLQMSAAIAPLGSASQRASVPQLPFRWDVRFSGYNLTYMRDYTIWSVEPLTNEDLNLLYSSPILRQAATPNMPSLASNGGSMSTTQMLSSQTRYYTADASLSGRVGWLKEMFSQQGGMGESAAAPHIYCTRVIAGQISTPSEDEVVAALGGGDGSNWKGTKFWISFPPSWEILNVGVIEPDELEYLTYMQRSVLAPVGR